MGAPFARVVIVIAMFLLPGIGCLGSDFVLVNNNSVQANGISVYELNSDTGVLTLRATLSTGGQGLGEPSSENPASLEQAISSKGSCIFALDGFTSDIAAFSAQTGYSLVGNYSNPSLNADSSGGSLALAPNGKFLYASYSTSDNIGEWSVNSDCSLTLVATYPAAAYGIGPLKVSPNGKYLVVPLPIIPYGGVDTYAINPSDGTLTDLGLLTFENPSCVDECIPFGMDFTKDSEFVVLASNVSFNQVANPIAIVCRLTSAGLKYLKTFSVENAEKITGNQIPFFSASGYAGAGNLYFGMYRGVVTAKFTERPLNITATSASQILPPVWNGSLAVIGNTMVLAQYPNVVTTLRINSDGSVNQLFTTQITSPSAGAFSLSVFPMSR